MQLQLNSSGLSAYQQAIEVLRSGLMERVVSEDAPDAPDAYDDFTAYKQYIWHRYERARHLDKLDWALGQVALYVESKGKQGIRNLIVSMPRRYGKTLTIGQMFPTWYLGRNPEHRIMLASYGATLVERTSRKARNVIRSPRYQSVFGHTLAQDSQSAKTWELSGHEGGMDAVAVRGGATGKGWHCFPAGTPIATELGNIPIDELVRLSKPPKVLGYNHKEGCTVWTSIEAVSEVQSDRLIEVKMESGRSLVCTQDHPIYIQDIGYVPAKELKNGFKIKTLPRLWNTDLHGQQVVSRMLRQATGQECTVNLYQLREAVQVPSLSTQESDGNELCGQLLLQEMQFGASCHQKRNSLCNMWKSDTGSSPSEVLFKNMPSEVSTKEAESRMSTLQDVICCQAFEAGLLLSELREQCSFKTNAWQGQFVLQGWYKLQQVVHGNESIDIGARSEHLCCLWDNRGVEYRSAPKRGGRENQPCDSSFRRKSSEQYCQQFGDVVPSLPYDTPQVLTDTVCMVTELCTGCQSVYDLQVEGCHNFFAEEVLVHNCLICDDLIKNREEAESELIRDKLWDELQDSFFNGADVPYAARIMIGTRWHPDDPIGRLLLQEPGEWVNLKFPAIAGVDDVLGREPGAALWDYKHNIKQLQRLEEKIPPYSWSSLWQQDPTPAAGGFFQRAWFRIVQEPPQIVYTVRFWDLAMSDKATADFTVGVKIGQATDGHFYVLDVVRRRVDWGALVDFMIEVMLQDGRGVAQGIEETGYMTRAVQDLNADPRMHSYSVVGYPVDTQKHIRALPVQAKLSSGNLHLIHAHWNDAYIDEFVSFRIKGSVHDDQVDATSGAWSMMDGQAVLYGYTSW